MGLLTSLLTLPVRGPFDGTLWIAARIGEAAEQSWNDPAALRAALVEAERQLLAGELSEESYDAIELDLLERLKGAAT
ncbi:gas vesicle protein GvpG [Cereibacter johrii]|uniref:Gas vesicle protein GvpG n=1 Tax=Cereibacter johrii TaxID=445629 RepID=A0ABX5J9Y1_9RHOB|nr:gas vesicle protein GvpG [Cereibacter johrii]ODM43531.1 gas vesicle protein [Cereibacter johrii]PTM78585.1 gas vesicle protein GvpG [Cereibacter johrii]RDS93318.1 gas vesicle protein [Cereibacter sphaeroides f. sp. denitrificans]